MIFGAIQTAGSGLTLHRKWLDAISDNIANLNTVRPSNEPAFQARFIEAQAKDYAQPGAGVEVAAVRYGDPVGRLVYEPDHPLADEQGMVRYPDIDLGDQMTQLLIAQRSYQANIAVVERARSAYEQALGLGK